VLRVHGTSSIGRYRIEAEHRNYGREILVTRWPDMLLTMPKFLIERSDKDASLYFLNRRAPNGNWSRKMPLRAPHGVKRALEGEGFTPTQIDDVLSLTPGSKSVIETN
jgi:hypothetical protein